MIDIVQEIREIEKGEKGNNDKNYFQKRTKMSRELFNKEVVNRFPNLTSVKLLIRRTECEFIYSDWVYDNEYYFFSLFIEQKILEYLSDEFLIYKKDFQTIIDLTKYDWNEQIKLRNRIFGVCSIIMAGYECFYDLALGTNHIDWDDLELSKEINIYPHDSFIEQYELMNKTNFILISNSEDICQNELNDFCLEILGFLENQESIYFQKAIYLSISEKLSRCDIFNQQELNILKQFVDEEISKLNGSDAVVVRSRKKMECGVNK